MVEPAEELDEAGSAGERMAEAGPRNILRVPEVLAACARASEGATVAEVSAQITMPRTSLYRIMRVLEQGGYLQRMAGRYSIGPAARRLGNLIAQADPDEEFPGCARATMEWLALETGESVTLGTLTADRSQMVFIDSIASSAMLRYTVPMGDHRPLYRSASGKAVLAFLSKEEQRDYLARAAFSATTPFTSRREEMPAVLDAAARDGWVYDRNGNVEGASALACPILNLQREAFAAVSIAGPTDRMDADIDRLRELITEAGERISRKIGYDGVWPPQR